MECRNQCLTREKALQVIRAYHQLPGMYPITVITRNDTVSYARLHLLLEELQCESSFRITEKTSSKKNFSSFRIEIFVESAEAAFDRQERISKMEGVIMIL